MLEELGIIVTISGAAFAVIWKLKDFIVERSDLELSKLIRDYTEKVIKKDMSDIRLSIETTKAVPTDLIEQLRKDLNRPSIINRDKKEARKKGKHSLLGVLATAFLASLNVFYPTSIIFGFTFQAAAIISVLGTFMIVSDYYSILSRTRQYVDELEEAIQKCEYLDIPVTNTK
jgi:hypothetical protein